MTFLETLRAQVGGLLRIKSQLYWYAGRGWDGVPGRICLVLDAAAVHRDERVAHTSAIAADADRLAALLRLRATPELAALLLIDGAPHWVWVAQADVEIL